MSEEKSSSPAPVPAPAQNPFAALGASGGTAAAFGGGFAFGAPVAAFGAPAAAAKADGEDGADGEGDDGEPAAEEECQAEYKPLVQLDEVETSTGEELEDLLFECKTKLYRFDPDSGEWKERGIGQAKLLQHKENKKVRMLMRQEKTLKIRANHLVMPGTKMEPHAGSDKAWVWSAVDFSEGEQKVELFCLRFGSVEKAKEFNKQFEVSMDINAKLIGSAPAPEVGEEGAPASPAPADQLAEGLDKVTVSEEEAK